MMFQMCQQFCVCNMNFLTIFRLDFFMLFQMEEHLKLN